jgi:hypothetical protein
MVLPRLFETCLEVLQNFQFRSSIISTVAMNTMAGGKK